jgi:hypothetical protein
MVESNAVLELHTDDGLVGYPANLFDLTGAPIPHLAAVQARLMQSEFMEEWTIAIWLNDRPAAWEGASAIDLLWGEWAEEVIAQAGEDRRSPLRERTERAAQVAIARPILDRFVELVADLPVDVADGTLFVTRETEVPNGVFAMSLTGKRRALVPMQFEISGELEDTAQRLAGQVRAQLASEQTGRGDIGQ